MSLSSLNAVKQEVPAHRIRNVALIFLISPDGKSVCLALHEGAKTDGRLNMSPLQGGVEEGESIEEAAYREVREEVGMVGGSPVMHLKTYERFLSADHPRAELYDMYMYHSVAFFAQGYHLVPQPPLEKASWCHLEGFDSQIGCMSEEKALMVDDSIKLLRTRSRDPFLFRKEILFPELRSVF